jgi:hypothetical protein
MYHSLKQSIAYLAKRKNFEDHLEAWRERAYHDNCTVEELLDKKIYHACDARLFHKIIGVFGEKFVKYKHYFLLSINLDWFQTLKDQPGITGAIYANIINLSSDMRILTGCQQCQGSPSSVQIFSCWLQPSVF